MTVKKLITELSKYPDDSEVITEGCDCVGDSMDVAIFDGKVIILREKGALSLWGSNLLRAET